MGLRSGGPSPDVDASYIRNLKVKPYDRDFGRTKLEAEAPKWDVATQAAGDSRRVARRSAMARVVCHAASASRGRRMRIWFDAYVMPPAATPGRRSPGPVGAMARMVAPRAQLPHQSEAEGWSTLNVAVLVSTLRAADRLADGRRLAEANHHRQREVGDFVPLDRPRLDFAHLLRHTAAKLRHRCGASIEDVCALLGHQSIATTAIYLRQVESDRDNAWAVVSAALGIETDLGPSAELAAPHPRYA